MKCTLTRQTDYIGLRMLFYREELVYDIRNLAYIESHGVLDEVPHPKHRWRILVRWGTLIDCTEF